RRSRAPGRSTSRAAGFPVWLVDKRAVGGAAAARRSSRARRGCSSRVVARPSAVAALQGWATENCLHCTQFWLRTVSAPLLRGVLILLEGEFTFSLVRLTGGSSPTRDQVAQCAT